MWGVVKGKSSIFFAGNACRNRDVCFSGINNSITCAERKVLCHKEENCFCFLGVCNPPTRKINSSDGMTDI